MNKEMQGFMKLIRELSEVKGMISGLYGTILIQEDEDFFQKLILKSQEKLTLVIDELIKYQFEKIDCKQG